MRILLSNDDGVHAEGIQTLAHELRKFAEVIIVAPDRNRSAASSALTLVNPLRLLRLEENVYSLNGTPADCVHLAMNGFLQNQVDLVISGINAGANLGDDVLYSGTVAAALEGRYLDLPAIAVSLCGRKHYDSAALVVCNLLPHLQQQILKKREILNINVPDLPYHELAGVRVCRLGTRTAAASIITQKDPRDENIYWIGKMGKPEDEKEDTDFYAIKNGYVAITPLQVDMTAHHSLAKVNTWLDAALK